LTGSARRRSRRRTAGGGGAGWRHRGCLKRVMPPNPRTRKYRPGATAPRACRLRVGTPAKNDAASAANPAQIMAASRLSPRIPIRTPAGAATTTAGGRRDGGWREGRYSTQPRHRKYRPAQPRRTCSPVSSSHVLTESKGRTPGHLPAGRPEGASSARRRSERAQAHERYII